MHNLDRSRPEAPDDADAFEADLVRGAAATPRPGEDRLRLLLAVLVGGFVGTLARAALTEAAPHGPTEWPWATFAANLAGAFVLGAVVAVLRARPTASGYWRPLLGTGLCGGLTTFSTLQLELVRMVDEGAVGIAVAYLAVSVTLGLLAVFAGLRVGGGSGTRTVDMAADAGSAPTDSAVDRPARNGGER